MFILRTALKYAFSKGKGQRTSSVVIVLGIALGLAALLVISSVMNGLQTAQLDQLRALESFDVSVEPSSGNDDLSLGLDDVSGIPGIDFAFEYIETYALVVDKTSGKSTSARVRAYSNDAYYSERMAQSLHFIAGEPVGMDGVAVSYTMMNTLSLHSGDDVEVTFLKPGRTATVVPYSTRMAIGALFGSSMTEFSSSTIFVDYQWLLSLMGESSVRIGIYTQNPESVASRIAELSPDSKAVTWKEYNRALYSALMLEKALMYIFLAFMFLIICVNLKNSTRRLLRNRQQEGSRVYQGDRKFNFRAAGRPRVPHRRGRWGFAWNPCREQPPVSFGFCRYRGKVLHRQCNSPWIPAVPSKHISFGDNAFLWIRIHPCRCLHLYGVQKDI